MIKNIVFDMGNVLIEFNAEKIVKEYISDPKATKMLINEVFRSTEWIKLDRGTISVDDAIFSLQSRIPKPYNSLVYDLVQDWHLVLLPYKNMEDLAYRLKKNGYNLYMLSNVSQRFYSYRERITALKYFDGEFVSSDYGLLKPEAEIYEAFYDKFNLDPEECYLIDDLPINIEAAERTGMKGFVYHGDINKLQESMMNIGITL